VLLAVREPAALAHELSAVGRVDEVGVSFGVLKVVCGGEDFDVSLPRTDSKVGSGHRGFEVRVDHDLDEVAAFGRRDYTVNAMGWDPATAELVDPYGGSADLEQGVLRHTTDAFDEDPLRVLRGMQLAGRFDLAFAPETAQRCRGLAGAFGELPRDRVWGEWCKVARNADHPSASLRALHESGWEHHFVELADLRDVPQDPRWHPEGPVHVHTALSADAAARAATKAGLGEEEREVVVLAAMLHDLGKATHTVTEADGSITSRGHAAAGVDRARRLLTRMGAPHRMHYLVGPLIAEHMTCAGTTEPTPAAVRRLTRRLSGPKGTGPTLTQWAAVVAADNAGRGTGSRPSPADAWVSAAATLGEGVRPRAGLLTGDHLIAAGMSPGPQFRPLLAAALAAQDEGSSASVTSRGRWPGWPPNTELSAWGATFSTAPPICWTGTAADEYRHLRPDLQDVWAPSTASVAPPITETPCTWGGDEFVSPRPGRGRRLGGGARAGTRPLGRTHTNRGPQRCRRETNPNTLPRDGRRPDARRDQPTGCAVHRRRADPLRDGRRDTTQRGGR